jgi:hypothetical protein
MVRGGIVDSYQVCGKKCGIPCKIASSMPKNAHLARYVELGMFLTRKRTTIHQFAVKLGMFCTHNRDTNRSFHPSKILSVNAEAKPPK